MHKLIGKTLGYVYISEDEDFLLFINEDVTEWWIYFTDADCCSYSYIESVLNPECLINSPIIAITDKEYEIPNYNRQAIKPFGWIIKTTTGYCDIECRNESEGYYFGDLLESVYQLADIEKQRPQILRGFPVTISYENKRFKVMKMLVMQQEKEMK